MENLNAEQVNKALELCLANDVCDSSCEICPYTDNMKNCMDEMLRDVLALINSQEQKIKELTEENEKLTIKMNAYGLTAKNLGEENERLLARNFDLAEKGEKVVIAYKKLSEENERLKAENEMLLNIKNLNIDKVIADTVRKMQERVKKCLSDKPSLFTQQRYIVVDVIDQIAKEMLEGDNER